MIRLANEFAKRGHSVDFVLAKEQGELVRDVASNVHIVNLGSNREWMALPGLLRYLKDSSPDVFLSAGDSSNIVGLWGKMLSSEDTKFVVSVHTNKSVHSRSGERWYGKLIPYLIRTSYPVADKIVAVSEGIKKDLTRIYPCIGEKTEVVYNPVIDQEIFEKAREPVSHPWLDNREIPVIIGVGRLTLQKNFELLLNGFAKLCKDREARLIIIGDGNQRAYLERQAEELRIEDKVDLHGFVDNPYSFMANASLLTLSSNFEGLPTVLIESLACGCPVVSTDCPDGPQEILENGKWGRLVPVNNEEALADAMMASLSEEHDKDHLQQRAMDFSVDKAIDNYLTLLFPDEDVGRLNVKR